MKLLSMTFYDTRKSGTFTNKVGENILCPIQITPRGLLGDIRHMPARINAHMKHAIWGNPEADSIKSQRAAFTQQLKSYVKALGVTFRDFYTSHESCLTPPITRRAAPPRLTKSCVSAVGCIGLFGRDTSLR